MNLYFISFFIITAICDQKEYYEKYGINFNEETEFEFLRYEYFHYDDGPIATIDSTTCEAARLMCYDYLRCDHNCEDRFVPKWEHEREVEDQELPLANPCVLMQYKCYGVRDLEMAKFFKKDF
ncbi:unnamed protein product [Caenorhabditis nigoni]